MKRKLELARPHPVGEAASLRRPMLRAHKVALLERVIKERLSPSGRGLLLAQARVVAEGRVHASSARFFGTVMITIDLQPLAARASERLDDDAVARLAVLAAADAPLLEALARAAAEEASRLAARPLAVAARDLRLAARGLKLHVDADVEG